MYWLMNHIGMRLVLYCIVCTDYSLQFFSYYIVLYIYSFRVPIYRCVILYESAVVWFHCMELPIDSRTYRMDRHWSNWLNCCICIYTWFSWFNASIPVNDNGTNPHIYASNYYLFSNSVYIFCCLIYIINMELLNEFSTRWVGTSNSI